MNCRDSGRESPLFPDSYFLAAERRRRRGDPAVVLATGSRDDYLPVPALHASSSDSVTGPQMPSVNRPMLCWNSVIAAWVLSPKIPSTPPG